MSDDRRPGLVPDVGDPDPPDPEVQLPALVGFVLDRLAEDQHSADDLHSLSCDLLSDSWPVVCDCGQPARVLADVAAKRRIVEMVSPWHEDHPDGLPNTSGSGSYGEAWADVLRLLALADAGHPDYRPEWRP